MSTHRLVRQGRNIVLVDTPGFDDSSVSDADTLSHISEWLEKRYKDNVPILGLLYFHRITDNRMSGTLTQNLALFRNICGREGLKKVVLVTTMWDQVATQANGQAYETELKQNFWKPFMDQGSMTRRFDFQKAQNSASIIIDALMSLPANTKPVLLQKQLVDIRLSLEQTNAGRVLYSQLHRYIRDRDGDFARYKEDYSEYETRIEKLQRDVDNLPKTEYETVLAEEERKQVQAVFDAFRGDFEDLKTTINQERTRVDQLKLTPLGWAKGGLAKVRHKIGL